MSTNYKRWRSLFHTALGLFVGTAFCMKWMEVDFLQNGHQFTIIGLEISYSKGEVARILAGLDEPVKNILRYHLSFDFAFMAGVYPGIAALSMMARDKSAHTVLRKILFALAILQLVAWGCDIVENCYLFQWIKNPVIGDDFGRYHFIVLAKWVIALTGVLIAIPLAIKRRKRM